MYVKLCIYKLCVCSYLRKALIMHDENTKESMKAKKRVHVIQISLLFFSYILVHTFKITWPIDLYILHLRPSWK